jgi:murein tripeptide amidase MpaA
MPCFFSSEFDGGNGKLHSIESLTHGHCKFVVHVADDVPTELEKKTFKQWFYFRLSNVKDIECDVSIGNAGLCAYPVAFENYNVCASYDRSNWFRVKSDFKSDSGVLSWKIRCDAPQIYFAYFPPYSYEQHLSLVAFCGVKGANVQPIGRSLRGHDIDMLTIGTGSRKVWFIARQHPGEPQGEWFLDGLLRRLLGDPADSVVRHLLNDATFYIVPNINPDGSQMGHLRTNAAGCNLNREWASTGDYVAPTASKSPEVFHCKLSSLNFSLIHSENVLMCSRTPYYDEEFGAVLFCSFDLSILHIADVITSGFIVVVIHSCCC